MSAWNCSACLAAGLPPYEQFGDRCCNVLCQRPRAVAGITKTRVRKQTSFFKVETKLEIKTDLACDVDVELFSFSIEPASKKPRVQDVGVHTYGKQLLVDTEPRDKADNLQLVKNADCDLVTELAEHLAGTKLYDNNPPDEPDGVLTAKEEELLGKGEQLASMSREEADMFWSLVDNLMPDIPNKSGVTADTGYHASGQEEPLPTRELSFCSITSSLLDELMADI